MLEIVKQVINFYYKNFKAIEVENIDIEDKTLLEKKWSIFVTLYLDGIVIWSSGNIKEIKDNIIEELIENTINALEDERFEKPNLNEKDNIKIRIDEIVDRWKPLADGMINKIDPIKNWVLVIKTDYSKAAVILPNISWKLMSWEDFIPILSKKLKEDFTDTNYLVYKIKTKIETDV